MNSLYEPPDDAELHPDPYGYDGRSWGTNWKGLPLFGKIMFIIVMSVIFPPMWGVYQGVWQFFKVLFK